jgi:peptidoglycan/xylan/chitin deacetylase (PgdA/CDA1 family)
MPAVRLLLAVAASLIVLGVAALAAGKRPLHEAQIAPLASGGSRPRVAILGYHEVEDAPTEGWSVRTDDFEAQLNLLSSTGWTVVPLRDLYDYVTGKRRSLPDRSVVITVDDGWLCTKTDMEPRFRKHGYPFTLFVYPKILGHGTHALSWNDVVTMSSAGADIQSHTVTHPHLNRSSHAGMTDDEYAAWLHEELAGSRQTLEKAVGKPVVFLAYPYGEHEAGVHAAAASLGYLGGVTSQTTQPDFNAPGTDPYQLRRFVVDSSTTLDRFVRSLGGAELAVEDMSPPLDTVIPPGQSTISARIKEPANLLPASVHIATLTPESATTHYDKDSGIVSVKLNGPLTTGRQQIAVWGDDIVSHERRIAVWTFYRSAEDKLDYEARAARLGALPFHHPAVKP